jgi:hypothetical protein
LVNIGGKVSAELLGYVHDFNDTNDEKLTPLGDIISGNLNFSASGANVDALIDLKLTPASFLELGDLKNSVNAPQILNEAYIRAFFGSINIEAGLRKLAWGKADSLGPLDVINPLDYSDLTAITDTMSMKIARPLVHISWGIGGQSKLEAVFIPNFAGHSFSSTGRWTPNQMSKIPDLLTTDMTSRFLQRYMGDPDFMAIAMKLAGMDISGFNFGSIIPDTRGIEYAQAGLRFTTTLGSADVGFQYFYGNLFRPAISFKNDGLNAFLDDLVTQARPSNADILAPNINLLAPQIGYNRYHQIGLDYAQVLFTLNFRSEFAVNLTEDLNGDNGSINNPFLAWSAGFDRDLFFWDKCQCSG